MASFIDNVTTCIETRRLAAELVAEIFRTAKDGWSEVDLRDALRQALEGRPELHDSGWYVPPPDGIAVLFADSQDVKRSQFATLRTEENWPSANYTLNRETIGTFYVSPVDKTSGMIGDLGWTFYRGENSEIQSYLKECLEVVEGIAEQAAVGMQLRKLHDLGLAALHKHGLHNDWMITYHDPTHGPDFGHTMPWTYELPTVEEAAIIDKGDMAELSSLISSKRRYLNPIEDFVIPETIAFGVEARLGKASRPELPGAYCYALVTFREGERQIFTQYNPIIKALGIDYMRSKY